MDDRLMVGDTVLQHGPHTAHVTLLLGRVDGPFKNAFSSVMTSHRPGYIPFLVCPQPNVLARPTTVFVNKNAYQSDDHGALHWGPAHLGVARGLHDGLAEGVLSAEDADELLCIAAAWVWETATDADETFEHNREATLLALRQAFSRETTAAETMDAVAGRGFYNLYHSAPPPSEPDRDG